MKPIKLAFLGTSDRSIPILEALKNSDFRLELCITKNDVKVGRNNESKATGVKSWCIKNGVNFVTIDSMSPESTQYIAGELKNHKIEIGMVADFSFIIPEVLLNKFKLGIINLHFSSLPYYRGASPVQFAILNNDKNIGITFQLVAKGMDTGPIIFQKEFPVMDTDTSEDLYESLFMEAAKLTPSVLNDYVNGVLKPIEQNHTVATYTYSKTNPKSTQIAKEDAKIDWKKPFKQIYQEIKAYFPWPISWTTLGEINDNFAKVKEGKNLNLKVKILKAHLEGNALKIDNIQVEGKSITDWKSFENGYLEK